MHALRKKYKNDKQTLQQETMKLYQQAGVNPLMGCLPVVLQLPVFFALFSVLKAIAEWKPGQAPKYGLHAADGDRAPSTPRSSASRSRTSSCSPARFTSRCTPRSSSCWRS